MKGSDDRHGHVRLDMIHPWFLILHAKQPCEKLKMIAHHVLHDTMAFQLNLVVSMLCHSDRKKNSIVLWDAETLSHLEESQDLDVSIEQYVITGKKLHVMASLPVH